MFTPRKNSQLRQMVKSQKFDSLPDGSPATIWHAVSMTSVDYQTINGRRISGKELFNRSNR